MRPKPSSAAGHPSLEVTTSSLAEELFAARFELNALADAVLAGKSERWVDDFVPLITAQAHRRRYEFAAARAAGRHVLDLSCGAGAGSYAMAEAGAASVVGIDIDPDAIRYARHRYRHERCRFAEGDAETWRPDSAFDLIVSFETIEHLRNPSALLATLKHALVSGGEILISTPVAVADGARPTNPYHLQEWTFETFVTLLRHAGFAVTESWYQGVRPHPGLVGRLRRRVGRLMGGRPERAAIESGEGPLESPTFYRRAGLIPKFQVHLVRHTDGS